MNAHFDTIRWRVRLGAAYARAYLHRLRLSQTCFVGITGSAGKTSTKDLCRAVLSSAAPTFGTTRTANTPDMIADTVLETTPKHRYCVLEIAAFKPGSLDLPIRLARPRIGVLTIVGRDHYSAFRSLDAIAEEKGKLITTLPHDGTAVVNIDDPRVRAMGERCKCRVIWIGEHEEATVRLIQATSSWPDPLTIKVQYQDQTHTIKTALHGKHLTLSVLAAVGVGIAAGMEIDEVVTALQIALPTEARMQIQETPDGIVFVRDDWKATHWTLDYPLAFMRDARANRKVIIMGTLSDSALGPSRLYPRVARQSLDAADLVLFTGNRASYAEKAIHEGNKDRLFAIPDVQQAASFLDTTLQPGDLVLLKGTNKSDHLVRLIMNRTTPVSCWKNDCRLTTFCYRCSRAFKDPEEPTVTQAVSSRPRSWPTRLSRRVRNDPAIQTLIWKTRVAYIGSRAWLVRRTLPRTRFIGITGSAGKTLTKDLSVHILSAFHQVTGTQESLNVPIAVSRTVLATKPTDDLCVVEIGAYKPGAFDRPLRLVRPTIGAVTIIGRDHYRAFKGIDGIAEEKGKLVAALPAEGTAVLNIDDPLVRAMGDRCQCRIIWVGQSQEAHVRLVSAYSAWPAPLTLIIEHDSRIHEVRTQLHGVHLALSVLTALGIALAAGIPLEKSIPVLARAEPTQGRMDIVASADGVTFIRDYMKAPAWSLDSPLQFLRQVEGYRRVAVIGTISDFSGDDSARYRQFARKAREHADLVVFVGPNAHRAVRARRDENDRSLLGFATVQAAAQFLRTELTKGDVVLLKGSNKVDHFERLFLDRNSPIRCWRERCKFSGFCPSCPRFHQAVSCPETTEHGREPSDHASATFIPIIPYGTTQTGRVVIAGLGNPESRYDGTPHNVGYQMLDSIAEVADRPWEVTDDGLTCTVRINDESVCLFKPGANMNVCGPKLRDFLNRAGSAPGLCIIVHDDMDLALGTLRLKRDGGDAGHRGVRSVVSALGTDAILRVRIGVRRPGDHSKALERVLVRFTEEEQALLAPALQKATAMINQHLPHPVQEHP